MEREVIRRRDATFIALYWRTISIYSSSVPPIIRWVMELALLLLAALTLLLWGYVHTVYIVDPQDCLTEFTDRPLPKDCIVQVEVYTNTTDIWIETQSEFRRYWSQSNISQETVNAREVYEYNLVEATKSGNNSLYDIFHIHELKTFPVDYTILEFTQEPGFLSLTSSTRNRLNISTRHLYINPEETECFGGPFGRFLTKYILGYDTMIIASFKNLLPASKGSGYVKNLLTGSLYYYRVQWMGKWRYIAGLLPTFFFVLVASILLRQIHYQGFRLITQFYRQINEGIPIGFQSGAQVPFLVVTYATIGLIIIMSEALGDDGMFSLLMTATVWEADQFFAVFCRHKISKTYFPMFFFLYHSIPYAYFLRFNGQFWFLPFLFHWLLLQNATLFFLNHYEINNPTPRRALPNQARHNNVPQQWRMQPVQPQQGARNLAEISDNVTSENRSNVTPSIGQERENERNTIVNTMVSTDTSQREHEIRQRRHIHLQTQDSFS